MQIVDDNQLTDVNPFFFSKKQTHQTDHYYFDFQDPQSAIIQVSLQLRNDAENVSGLTNRIAQMIRDREDVREKNAPKEA